MMFRRGYNGFSNGFGFGSGFMHGGLDIIMMVAFILLTVIAVIYFVNRTNHQQPRNEALESLKMRFAKGEISEEDYLKRKNIID